MAVWKSDLYQNDTSMDVKDGIEYQFHSGKKVDEITTQLIEDYHCLIEHSDGEALFGFALAGTQRNWGVLLPYVKAQALLWIEKCRSTEYQTSKIQIAKRLDDLRLKLNSPQPPVKKPVKRSLYKCEWKIGDVFAYRLESDLAKEKGLFGRYFLIQKVDEGVWYPGHIVPIVYVKITNDEKLPADIEAFDQLEYVQTSSCKFDLMIEEFRPMEKNLKKEEFWKQVEGMKAGLQFDEYGYLQNFRIKLLNTSKRIIPKKLICIGNFKGTMPPKLEYVRKDKNSLPILSWGKSDKTIERNLINSYFNFNKKQAKIYES